MDEGGWVVRRRGEGGRQTHSGRRHEGRPRELSHQWSRCRDIESERGQETEVDERVKKTEVVSTGFGRAAACTCFEGTF